MVTIANSRSGSHGGGNGLVSRWQMRNSNLKNGINYPSPITKSGVGSGPIHQPGLPFFYICIDVKSACKIDENTLT